MVRLRIERRFQDRFHKKQIAEIESEFNKFWIEFMQELLIKMSSFILSSLLQKILRVLLDAHDHFCGSQACFLEYKMQYPASGITLKVNEKR